MDGWTRWLEVDEPELPEGLPKPDAYFAGSAALLELTWFQYVREPELEHPAAASDVYVCRVGNGGTPPYVVMVYTVPKVPAPHQWPALPFLWDVAAELCLPGALFQLPVFVSGMAPPEFGVGTVVALQQVGALKGTAAGKRYELAGAGVSLDKLAQGAPGGGFRS